MIYGKFKKSQETTFYNFQIITSDCLLTKCWVVYSCIYQSRMNQSEGKQEDATLQRVKDDLISTNENAAF